MSGDSSAMTSASSSPRRSASATPASRHSSKRSPVAPACLPLEYQVQARALGGTSAGARPHRRCRSADAATSARSSTPTRRTTPRQRTRRRSRRTAARRANYQAEYDRIWQTYGFDGDLSDTVVEDGVAYRQTPNGRFPVARETTTGIWTPVLGLPDRDASPRQIVRYLYTQNLPGAFPFTEGAYRFPPPRRGPHPYVRRARDAGDDELPLPHARRRTRRAATLDRIRLAHPLRTRLRRARRARQGRGRAASPSTRSTTCCASTTASTSRARPSR